MLKSVSTKLPEETYDSFREYCQVRRISMNECISGLIYDLLGGKIKFKAAPLGEKIPFCPDCGFCLFYCLTKTDGPHIFCVRCGWWSKVKLPEEWHEGEFEVK